MLIERAIQKLKKTGGSQQRSIRPRAPAPRPSAGAATAERVVFPTLELDSAVLEANRIVDFKPATGRDPRGQSAFRMLRSRLLNRIRTENWSALAVTSPGAGEGKTLVALNLALSLAREGSSDVFLLDFDMRNPSICRYLGVSPPREITDYFAGSAEAGELFFSAGHERLAIAGGINASDSASEFVASAAVEDLLAYIRGAAPNPLIIIDLPPILVSDEAVLLAPRVDATALVIAEGRTDRSAVPRAKQLLEGHGFAGVILNRATDVLAGADYYGYGQKNYGA